MSEAAVDFDFDQDGRLNRNAGGNDQQHHRVGGPERPESLVAARKGWLMCRGIALRPSP